jgi:ATP synthase protein I
MSEERPPPSRKELGARIREAMAKRSDKPDRARDMSRGAGLSLALRLAMELVVGFAVGVGIGLGLDYWLGTAPLFLIVFFFLGAGAGMLNVYRVATGTGQSIGYKKPPPAPK